MKKPWIIILILLIAALVVIQFFQPERNLTRASTTDDIFFQVQADQLVKKDLVNACYDCHSNRTRYPFYANFAPISWMMNKHILEGKAELNFSEWDKYDKREQLKLLTEICEVISTDDMPLKSYILMHSNAILNEKEKEEICAWTEAAAEEIFNK